MITVLYGSNDLAIRRYVEEIVGSTNSSETLDPPTKLTGTVSIDEIVGAAFTAPFFSNRRIVIVENFIQNFESKGSRSRKEKKASFEPLLEVLETGFPKTTELIFREGEISQRNPLLEKLKSFKDVKIEVFPELRTQELVPFIENEASLKGLRFTKGPSKRSLPQDEEWRRPTETDPVKLLATSFGSSPDAIANELAKLSLYVQGREVSVDDVDLICGVERQATVWQLIDGVLDGDARKTYDACAVLFFSGESVQSLISLIAGRYRMLASVQEMLEGGFSYEEISSRNNIRFGIQKTVSRARRLGFDGPQKALEILVAADYALKTGSMNDQVAFEHALARLLLLSPIATRR